MFSDLTFSSFSGYINRVGNFAWLLYAIEREIPVKIYDLPEDKIRWMADAPGTHHWQVREWN